MTNNTASTTKVVSLADEFRKSLIDEGLTLKQWAEDREYDPEYCSRVLNGMVKGVRGKGHDIKVAMGLKADLSAQSNINSEVSQ